jgi:hypothetical protein
MSESFNACEYLLDRRLAAGDENRLALTGSGGELTYGQLHQQVLSAAGALRYWPAARAADADVHGGLGRVRDRLPGRDADRSDPGCRCRR